MCDVMRGHDPTYRFKPIYEDRSLSTDQGSQVVFNDDIRPSSDVRVLDAKVEAYRRSALHLNLISAVDGSILNWFEQNVLRELMSEDLLFAKLAEPDMTAVTSMILSVTEWAK